MTVISHTTQHKTGNYANAAEMDANDPLGGFRELFHIPPGPDGKPSIYLCGNSLGCQARGVRERINRHLDEWAQLGVEGHLEGSEPWYSYHELVREPAARLVGALPHEVVMMNSLTVNLHLLMRSFYRPDPKRHKIMIDGPCFPSDVYAVKSHIRSHGFDPEKSLVWVRPGAGNATHRTEDFELAIAEHADSLSMVLFAGVNYITGQHYEMARITRAAHNAGAIVGWDLAHAAGNVVLKLHDWEVDFAAWCSYKYLNGGPGAVAGAFVHERWTRNTDEATYQRMPRYEGWWGNDPATRFKMVEQFTPVRSADAWQLSNPPIFSLVPVKVSLEIFDEAEISALREKSVKLTGYLEFLLREMAADRVEIVTPDEANARGCQLSLRMKRGGREVLDRLKAQGVICDFREPDVIRVAPVPLYNTFEDCRRFVELLVKHGS